MINNSKIQIGKMGEDAAVGFLKRKGYKIIQRNYKNKLGEIDIIAKDSSALCFIEVKTRADENFAPAENAITPAKKTRMSRTARYFLAANNINDRALRFDVVTIVLNDTSREEIRHYK